MFTNGVVPDWSPNWKSSTPAVTTVNSLLSHAPPFFLSFASAQELLRHASSRVTMDTYTHAVTSQKRKAQSDVGGLIRTRETLTVGG